MFSLAAGTADAQIRVVLQAAEQSARAAAVVMQKGAVVTRTRPSCSAPMDGLSNPFSNCGFEDGFTGWRIRDIDEPFAPLAVVEAGAVLDPLLNFFAVEPSEGLRAASTGFDGNGPGSISIEQTVRLPRWTTRLLLDYRAAWDFAFGSSAAKDRSLAVVVRHPRSQKELYREDVLVARAGSFELDSGAGVGSVDLGAFAGKRVSIAFEWSVPESKAGPGWFQLDNIRLEPPQTIGCSQSVGGKVGKGPSWFRFTLPRQTFAQEFSIRWSGAAGQAQLQRLGGKVIAEGQDKLELSLEPLARRASAKKGQYLVSVAPPDSVATGDRYSLETTCTLGARNPFETPDEITAVNDTVGSAQWHWATGCPESQLPGHSGLGVARWGNPYSCTDYATAGATTDVLTVPLSVDLQTANPCAGQQLQLAFSYFLDLEDDAEFDRVRVELGSAEGEPIVLLDNGEVGGLTAGTGEWQTAAVNLPQAGEEAPAFQQIRFIGETSDDLNNWGRGFLIDDVRLECREGAIAQLGFELGLSEQ